MEARRRKTRARLVCAAPAETRLADVVRRFGNSTPKSMVHRIDLPLASRLARSEQLARKQSIPGQTATLRSRDVLSLSIYNRGRASPHRRVVETRGASGIPADPFARAIPVSASQRSFSTPTFGTISRSAGGSGLETAAPWEVLVLSVVRWRDIFAARWRKKNRSSLKAP